MTKYDPDVAPNPVGWLELDEQERIRLVEVHHQVTRIKLPNLTVHAVIHATVENQIAQGLASVVRAMPRLMKQGLSRHDALHAIGSVLAEHLFEAMKADATLDAKTAQARYDAAVERLSAKEWRRRYGS